MRVALDAPAKINLRLRVGSPADDGFHPLSTLFCALDLADTVAVDPHDPEGPGLDVTFGPPLDRVPDLGDPGSNLATLAARRFLERAGLADSPPPRIHLTKRIPAAGGLGGGSSDAAAVLRAMDRLHPGAVPPDGLADVAAGLGSDVPFFLLDSPLARAEGRGERLTPLAALPPRPVVLVLPAFGVSTAAAYRWLDEDRGGTATAAGAPGPTRDWGGVAESATNDLEAPVFARYPVLRSIRDALRDAGAAISLMAGSGSSVFGVFEDARAAAAAARRVTAGFDATAVVTATRPG